MKPVVHPALRFLAARDRGLGTPTIGLRLGVPRQPAMEFRLFDTDTDRHVWMLRPSSCKFRRKYPGLEQPAWPGPCRSPRTRTNRLQISDLIFVGILFLLPAIGGWGPL